VRGRAVPAQAWLPPGCQPLGDSLSFVLQDR
jgi:hypothetical protein